MSFTSSIDGFAGTVLCLFLAWLSFAFTISAAAGTPSPRPLITHVHNPPPPPNRLALALASRQRQRASRLARLAHLHHISHTLSTNAFPLTSLPPELQLLILAHLAPYPHTYRALTRVSHSIYTLTLRACIPCMPITLSTTTHLTSFSLFLASPLHHGHTLHVPGLVHRLWVCPLRRFKEDKDLATSILKRCTNVRILACDARTLRTALNPRPNANAKPTRLRHTHCTYLTLLLGRPGWDTALAPTTGPSLSFLQRLTHLRVPTAQCIPRAPSLTRLTHISYRGPDRHSGEGGWEGEGVRAQERFPVLREVVVTSSRLREGQGEGRKGGAGAGQREQEGQEGEEGVVVHYVHIPRECTEMHLWREGAGAGAGAKRGLWVR